MITSQAKPKTCPRCGAAFGCSVEGRCWCMEEAYKLPMPKAGEAAYSDCLCRSCLRDYALELGWKPADSF